MGGLFWIFLCESFVEYISMRHANYVLVKDLFHSWETVLLLEAMLIFRLDHSRLASSSDAPDLSQLV